eukprot:1424072-Amphidinium_carterae.1
MVSNATVLDTIAQCVVEACHCMAMGVGSEKQGGGNRCDVLEGHSPPPVPLWSRTIYWDRHESSTTCTQLNWPIDCKGAAEHGEKYFDTLCHFLHTLKHF